MERDASARALALDDLSAEQRAELESAIARYRTAQREVIMRLIAANREWDKERPYSSFANPEREEAKLKWDQVRFERDELDAGMLATLRRVLSPAQRQAIGVESK